MISRIVNFALHQKLFVWLGLIIFVAGGLAAFKNLPIEAFPDVSDIQVNVITLYPGRAAEEVERQVTIPIETALAGTPNSVRVFSHTQFGLSFMMVTFNDKATDIVARQQIIERLRSVDLPDGVQPELAPLSTAIGEIYRFRLSGKGYTPQELRTLQDWVVEKNLRQVPGVADVVTIGGSIKQYEVNRIWAACATARSRCRNCSRRFSAATRTPAVARWRMDASSTCCVRWAASVARPTSPTWWWPRTTARRSWSRTSPRSR